MENLLFVKKKLQVGLFHRFDLPYIVSYKFFHIIVSDKAGGYSGGITLFQLGKIKVCVYNGGLFVKYTGIDQIIEEGSGIGGIELGTQIVYNQKVTV